MTSCRTVISLYLNTVFAAVVLLISGPNNAVAEDVLGRAQLNVSIPYSQHIEFVSKVNGHHYSLDVAFPFGPPPTKGYGVLYVLDGFAYFASAAEAVRGGGDAPGVMVVGINYPNDPRFVHDTLIRRGPVPSAFSGFPAARIAALLERNYDLTLPATNEELSAQIIPGTQKQKSENVGGLDDFLKMIETDVKPRVASLAPINRDNQAIFGHSLGGLAVLHALFVEPRAFQTFIIASPSIWWNHKAVLAGVQTFASRIGSQKAAPRVLVTVGGEESAPPRDATRSRSEVAALKTANDMYRMVENGRELVARLKAIKGGAGYAVADYAIFENQDHGISPWPAMARGIAFAFKDHR